MRRKLLLLTGLVTLLAACARPASLPDPSVTPTSLPPASTATFTPPLPTGTPTSTPTASPTQSGQVTLLAVGDIMLGRSVGDQVIEKGPQTIFAGVQSVLDQADLRIGNLECALTDIGTPAQKSFTLLAPPQATQALVDGGFQVVSLANNHAMDYGAAGLAESQKLLSQAGVSTVGAGANFIQAHTPVFLERNGLRLAFLAYVDVPEERDGFDTSLWTATETSPGVAWADPTQIKLDVAAARQKADVVVVLLHSGNEISTYLSTITSGQRDEAHAAIDAGAALVVGSHPHELQSIERYHGGLIAYSLGNFVFDKYLGIANATILLRVRLDRSGFRDYDYVPALIDNGLPHVITPNLVPAIGTLVAPVNP